MHERALLRALRHAVTGVWPFISLRTFEAVSGPRVDRWLVRTVGLLVTVIEFALAGAWLREIVAADKMASAR